MEEKQPVVLSVGNIASWEVRWKFFHIWHLNFLAWKPLSWIAARSSVAVAMSAVWEGLMDLKNMLHFL